MENVLSLQMIAGIIKHKNGIRKKILFNFDTCSNVSRSGDRSTSRRQNITSLATEMVKGFSGPSVDILSEIRSL